MNKKDFSKQLLLLEISKAAGDSARMDDKKAEPKVLVSQFDEISLQSLGDLFI
jgi:hypothetical protein